MANKDDWEEVEIDDWEDQSVEDPMSQAKAALLGSQQGLTFGSSDEIGGAVQSGLDKTQRLLNEYTGLVGKSPTQVSEELAQQGFHGDLGPTSSGELYDDAVAEGREELATAEEQHPWTTGVADVATGIATGGLGAKMVSKGATKIPGLLDKFNKLSKAKQAATVGAGAGALESAGRTEEDLASIEGLTDVAVGAGTGGVAGGILGKLGSRYDESKLLKKSDDLLEDADDLASRSLGAKDKDISAAAEARYKFDSPRNSGIQALEEGLVDPLSRPKETYKKALASRKAIQSGYDDAIGQFDNAVNLSENQALDLSKQYYERVKSKVVDTIKGNDQIPKEMKQALGEEVSELQDEILSALDSTNPIKELQDLYVRHNDVMFKNLTGPTVEARKVIRNEIKSIQRELADTVKTGAKDAFGELDEKYTSILDIEKWSNSLVGKKNTIGMGDVIKGATARMLGIPGLGEVVTASSIATKKLIGKDITDVAEGASSLLKFKQAKKLQRLAKDPGMVRGALRDRPLDAAVAAVTGSTPAIDSTRTKEAPYKIHQRASKEAEKASPEELTAQAQSIREEYGEEGDKLSTLIDNMSQKNVNGRRAAMFHILQNPQYRRMMKLVK
jgi:hypothetical protein